MASILKLVIIHTDSHVKVTINGNYSSTIVNYIGTVVPTKCINNYPVFLSYRRQYLIWSLTGDTLSQPAVWLQD